MTNLRNKQKALRAHEFLRLLEPNDTERQAAMHEIAGKNLVKDEFAAYIGRLLLRRLKENAAENNCEFPRGVSLLDMGELMAMLALFIAKTQTWRGVFGCVRGGDASLVAEEYQDATRCSDDALLSLLLEFVDLRGLAREWEEFLWAGHLSAR